MCGLSGTIYGTKAREPEERSYLKWLFMYLLLLSERRGPYATGIAWLKADGSHNIFKRPMRAVEFVKERQFVEVISQVNDDVTWLAGHTRWPTRGPNVQDNAHPIRGGAVVGCHNGTVLNADALFRRFGLPRNAEVDSEIIFRMADATLRDGCINIPAMKERLAICRGQISAVMASKHDPKRVVVIKGNMPLELRCSPRYQAVVYASDPAYLDIAFAAETGWRKIVTRPMSIMTFDCENLPEYESVPFRLAEGGRSHGRPT